MTHRALSCLLILGWLGCSRPEVPQVPSPATNPASLPSATSIAASTPSSLMTSTPASLKLPIQYKADYCKESAACAWDDPCMAERCVSKKSAAPSVACEESRPLPGECLCLESYCTLKPKEIASVTPAVVGCKSDDDCEFEPSSGACMARGKLGGGPIKTEGGMCTCEPKTGACKLEWVGPVPCKTYKDCSWTRSPLRPVPSSVIPRPNPKPVKPCSTGEVDSVCKDNVCTIVGWSC